VPNRNDGDPKLVGANRVRVVPGTKLAAIVGDGEHDEGFFCNYEVNPDFVPRFAGAGLRINALGGRGELRGIELTNHPFFMGTLFQPQLTSKRTGKPHPVITSYLEVIRSHCDTEAAPPGPS
jgi:CTP synthase (UTP-ammonia lyase)